MHAHPTASQVIDAVRARGSDADDLRDAVHEACHAIDWRVPEGKWDRESIHRKMPRDRVISVCAELNARAVEQVVCRDLGVDCGSVEQWAYAAVLEAIKYGLSFAPVDQFAAMIKQRMESVRVRRLADAVTALPSTPFKTRRRVSRTPGERPVS